MKTRSRLRRSPPCRATLQAVIDGPLIYDRSPLRRTSAGRRDRGRGRWPARRAPLSPRSTGSCSPRRTHSRCRRRPGDPHRDSFASSALHRPRCRLRAPAGVQRVDPRRRRSGPATPRTGAFGSAPGRTGSALPRRYESVQIAPAGADPGQPPVRRVGLRAVATTARTAPSSAPTPAGRRASSPAATTAPRWASSAATRAAIKDRSLLIKLQEYLPVGLSPVLIHLPAAGPRRARLTRGSAMATDVARLSFDPARSYTGVVAAAGPGQRWRPSRTSSASSTPRSAGRSCSTSSARPARPDDGYAVSATAAGSDLTIGAGTMYVGGLRVGSTTPSTTRRSPTGSTTPVTRTGSSRRTATSTGRRARRLWLHRDATSPPSRTPPCARRRSAARTARPHQAAAARPAAAHRQARSCSGALAGDAAGLARRRPHLRPRHRCSWSRRSRLLVTWEGDPRACRPVRAVQHRAATSAPRTS